MADRAVMFLYPSEILAEYERKTGNAMLSPETRHWMGILDQGAVQFDAQGREDRQAGRPAADWACFTAWAAKQFGEMDVQPIAELVQDYYMDAYNSGLSRRKREK